MLNVLAQNVPWFLGGSADLGPSNKTTLTFAGAGDLQADSPGGRNVHFGVREHAMGSIMNGLSLTKLRPFGGTFFIFSDYARPAIRLSALMELPTVFVFTHDALSDGEDGPTHQPVEHLASLRAIPGLVTLRPGDANEVVEAYRYLMPLRHRAGGAGPVAAAAADARSQQVRLGRRRRPRRVRPGRRAGRQARCDSDRHGQRDRARRRGARERSLAEGVRSRVVSMPSWDIFEHQSQEYRDSVLPPQVTARVAIEQASAFGWERYVGRTGRVIGMQTFGASAPLKELQKEYGFTVEKVVAAAKAQAAPGKKA